MSELRIEYHNPNELKPYENNARDHKEEDIEAIRESIREFGFNIRHMGIGGSMTKAAWKEQIIVACTEAGTYRTYFDSAIDTLAGIMETRDNAQEKFEASGGNTVVAHTNKGGATNIVKNPALVVVDDLNKTALSYWRDLGLTPAGLKRINETALKGGSNKNTLGSVLKDLGI